MPVISPITACEISVIKQNRSEELNIRRFALWSACHDAQSSLHVVWIPIVSGVPDFLEPGAHNPE